MPCCLLYRTDTLTERHQQVLCDCQQVPCMHRDCILEPIQVYRKQEDDGESTKTLPFPSLFLALLRLCATTPASLCLTFGSFCWSKQPVNSINPGLHWTEFCKTEHADLVTQCKNKTLPVLNVSNLCGRGLCLKTRAESYKCSTAEMGDLGGTGSKVTPVVTCSLKVRNQGDVALFVSAFYTVMGT